MNLGINFNRRPVQLGGTLLMGTGLWAVGRWYFATKPGHASAHPSVTALDHFLPEAEFRGAVSSPIQASPYAIFQALGAVTVADMPLARWLGELRYWPGRLLGRLPTATMNTQPFLQELMADHTTIILAERPDQEVVLGTIGKFHNLLDQHMVSLSSPQAFLDFKQPEYQKLAMSVRLTGDEPAARQRLTLEHRTQALSPAARWKFALYWLGIKPGGNFVSWLLLRAIKRRAEQSVGLKT
jgi:hypothetical protein